MRALLIDVDGTMVDSYSGVIDSYLHALNTVGVTHPSSRPLRAVLGPPMVDSFVAAGVPTQSIDRAREAYFERYRSTGWYDAHAYAGVEEFLAWAKDQGFLLCTATSKGEFFTHKVLEHFGLAQYFDFFATAGDHGERPTKADVVAYALELCSLPSDKALMIGDRSHDISGAHAHGVPVAAVAWGYGTPDERAEADFDVATPEELTRIVHEHFHNSL